MLSRADGEASQARRPSHFEILRDAQDDGMFDVVIPARNEERTVAFVVRAALESAGARRVIVVDDHSTDRTARLARDAGAEVIASGGNSSKALALATGVAASTSPVM